MGKSPSSTTKVRTVVITPQDPVHPKVLILELEIDCPVCGDLGIQLAGHHLRAIWQILGDVIAANPELCGKPGQEIEGSREQWGGMVDPRKVELN